MDELIAELAPRGVEFRELRAVIELNFGTRITKRQNSGTLYPVYGGGGASFYTDHFNREDEYVVSRFAMSETCVRRVTGKFWMLDSGFTFEVATPDVLKEFVAYWLFSHQPDIYACSSQGAQKNLKTEAFKRFRLPVPPIEVQREIVRILDAFGSLEGELEAELKARRRQYAFYQDSLLSFPNGGARWMTLGEIGKVVMCKRVFKTETSRTGEIPFYKIGTFGREPDAYISHELYELYRGRYAFPKKGDVLISAAGTIGRAVPYDGKPAYFQDSNIVWIDNDESLVKNSYLRYWYRMIDWTTDGGTIRRLYNENIRRARIAVPSLAEQDRMVAILDKFDALVDNLSIGLPAELNARRQQYEYYRDRLLTFSEAA